MATMVPNHRSYTSSDYILTFKYRKCIICFPLQALVNFDQALMTARDIGHVVGECGGLVGMAKSYLQMGEQDTCLTLCGEVDQVNRTDNKLTCETELVRARALLELVGQNIRCSCAPLQSYYHMLTLQS